MQDYFKRLYTKDENEYAIKVSKYLDSNTKKFILTANPEMFKLATNDKELESYILDKNNDVIPDGIAIVKGAKHYKINVKERITGCDLAVKLLEFVNQKKKTVYLFGATKEVNDKLVALIKEKYPKIKILGNTDGYVKDKDKVMKKIIDLEPDVCLVALGIPNQEKLIGKYIDKASKGIYVGVGGSFDVISGYKKRAPKIFIKFNLEWFYRIVTEPSRLKRFWNNNVKFMFSIWFDKK